jgi:hypothetical protein
MNSPSPRVCRKPSCYPVIKAPLAAYLTGRPLTLRSSEEEQRPGGEIKKQFSSAVSCS